MSGCPFSGGGDGGATRRRFLTGAAGIAGFVGAAGGASAKPAPSTHAPLKPTAASDTATLPFHGAHQQGIATAQQAQIHFAALDLTTESRADVAALMQGWTQAAASLTAGQLLGDGAEPDPTRPSRPPTPARSPACRPRA